MLAGLAGPAPGDVLDTPGDGGGGGLGDSARAACQTAAVKATMSRRTGI